MKRIIWLSLLIMLLLALPGNVAAQDSEYALRVKRTMGYGAGIDVRGSMNLVLVGDMNNVQSVTYLINGQEMATVSEAPFEFPFRTSAYPVGHHELSAVITTLDGRQVTTAVVERNFISTEEQSDGIQRFIFPLLGGVFVLMLLGLGGQMLLMRKDGSQLAPGAARSYGFHGGTICPRCGRAYPIHFLSPHAGPWRLDRCDFCGKFAIVTRRSPAELAIAEQAELIAVQESESSLPAAEQVETEEERLRKMLDESKYAK